MDLYFLILCIDLTAIILSPYTLIAIRAARKIFDVLGKCLIQPFDSKGQISMKILKDMDRSTANIYIELKEMLKDLDHVGILKAVIFGELTEHIFEAVVMYTAGQGGAMLQELDRLQGGLRIVNQGKDFRRRGRVKKLAMLREELPQLLQIVYPTVFKDPLEHGRMNHERLGQQEITDLIVLMAESRKEKPCLCLLVVMGVVVEGQQVFEGLVVAATDSVEKDQAVVQVDQGARCKVAGFLE